MGSVQLAFTRTNAGPLGFAQLVLIYACRSESVGYDLKDAGRIAKVRQSLGHSRAAI